MRIVLLSDTHGYMDADIIKSVEGCDEIWHAGDVGNIEILKILRENASVRAVYGNIDSLDIRAECPEYHAFEINDVKFLMIHIAGSPPRYNTGVRKIIQREHPDVLVCGHSHILKVQADEKNNLLYINPGAAGHHGLHKIRTLLQFRIDQGRLRDLAAIELGKRGRLNH